MRITNTIRTNTTMRNVNRSKTNLHEAENQMSSEKKITRPSDDPIVAIRALSLRSTLSEINMYLKDNIPEGKSWLRVTEGALDNMDGLLSNIYEYSTQGSSDQFTEDDRSAIIQTLQKFKDGLYAETNTDYAGRYVFTGYRTDSTFTFQDKADYAQKKYSIKQTFKNSEIDTVNVMKNGVDTTVITNIPANTTPETRSAYRLRLAYSGCQQTGAGDVTIDGTTYTPQAITHEQFETMVTDGTFDGAANTFYYIYDTGELIMTDDLYDTVKDAEEISFTYEKEGFRKEDVKPEMYFDCTDITDPANPHEYLQGDDGQLIYYAINFGQTLQVNTLGNKTLSYDIGRDIDDMCNSLQAVADAEAKVAKLKEMKSSDIYTDAQKKDIETMQAAAQKELDYAIDNMKKLFQREMGRVKGYQETVDLQMADLGARSKRLTLTESRLTEQYTTFDDLKSVNEDAELEETVVNVSSAKALYQAALGAASTVIQQSLLDYIR